MINEAIELCSKEQRIPLKYRTNKELCRQLLNTIKQENITIKNPHIYSLASWLKFNINNYNSNDEFSVIESIDYIGNEQTYDLSIKNKHSYVANGIICHNTVNLPNNVKEEVVAEIYKQAWHHKLKGITVYRDGCRAGVLIKGESGNVTRDAPKRPKELECEIYHVTVTKKLDKVRSFSYLVALGILDGKPYEIFAIENGKYSKTVSKGMIIKHSRGNYELKLENGESILNITEDTTDQEDALTRMVSLALRHGVPIHFIVEQLNKVKGEMFCFAKSISRSLKKYIEDGTKSTENCINCDNKLIFENGCFICKNCGYSKCM